MTRRRPRLLVAVAGWVAVGLVIGCVLYGVGALIGWVSDTAWGANP